MGIDNGLLVITVTGVTTHKLHQLILVNSSVLVSLNQDSCRGRKSDLSAVLRHYTGSGVYRRLAGHTGIHHCGFGNQKWHCLTLHVGSHQSTVRVIVLQERNHGSRYREYHLRGYVH